MSSDKMVSEFERTMARILVEGMIESTRKTGGAPHDRLLATEMIIQAAALLREVDAAVIRAEFEQVFQRGVGIDGWVNDRSTVGNA